MSVSRADWDLLVTEYKAVKKQLRSKQEALRVLQQQVKTLEEDCLRFKEVSRQQAPAAGENVARQATSSSRTSPFRKDSTGSRNSPGSTRGQQSPRDSQDIVGAVALEGQLEKLTAQHNEVVQEKRALQQRLERFETANREKGVSSLIAERDKALRERNELVEQLEKTRTNVSSVQLDLDASREELEEALREKLFFSAKCDRLNKQLLRCLQERKSSPEPDTRDFIDIDALQVENKYLKERLAKSGEEKQELIEVVSKHKQRAPRLRQALRNATADVSHAIGRDQFVHTDTGTHRVGSPAVGGSKSIRKVYTMRSTIADLQAMVATLSDSLRDKNLALQHSKAVNKTLAQRVMAMERQLGVCSSVSSASDAPGTPPAIAALIEHGPHVHAAFTPPSPLLPTATSQSAVEALALCEIDLSDDSASLAQEAQNLQSPVSVTGDGVSEVLKPFEAELAGVGDESDDAVEWEREQVEADQDSGDAGEDAVPSDSGTSDEDDDASWTSASAGQASGPLSDGPEADCDPQEVTSSRSSSGATSTERSRLVTSQTDQAGQYGGAQPRSLAG